MLGAIAGDIIGSVHEGAGTKTTEFPLFVARSRFTDDTVLTVAVADCLLDGGSYVDKFHKYTHAFPNRGYGAGFWRWVQYGAREPYNSWGNGSAMRVSPVAFAFQTVEEVLNEARASAEVTHNHPEGIRGAQSAAAATFLARQGASKKEIREFAREQFGYDLSRTIADIRTTYEFDLSCQGTVPEAMTPFWNLRITSTRSGWQFRLAVMPILWHASPVELLAHFMEVSHNTSRNLRGRYSMTSCVPS